ncbi:beta strand repeat-containing protein [Arenimonas oryziterrae]|uniref:DUF11 domain-containing protein n=1 Tax=Arenimonas oryziterrae DSM 21050 = YC6267 TaxID=1121015 RepID=A0A091APV3_9GAMM|nr:DUF11 domain-containing protein [Arenimonas oryziterrae]KFN41177.1 hypothetical protein N789_04640 [Arenimonas oryziterrae DSM 21050 = YC6267]
MGFKAFNRGLRLWRAMAWVTLSMLLGLFVSSTAQAQIQRSFLNSGFETPVLPANCAYWIPDQFIPGWNTTEPTTAWTVFGGCTIPPALTTPGPVIEMWTTGFNGVATATGAGNQYAELNSNSAATQYQTVCLVNGESGSYSFLHRGRSSTTTGDVMDFQVLSTAGALVQQIVRVSTTSNGTASAAPVAGPSTVLGANALAGNGWRQYQGTFVYTGAGGVNRLALTAVSAAGGITSGNFLDEFVVTLRPVVEFEAAASSGREAVGTGLPRINVSGIVPVGGVVVAITVTGGTATLGTDYTTPTGVAAFTMTIPAGNYDGVTASSFALPITVTNEAIIENNETITFQVNAGATYNISSIATCGGAGRTTSTYTLIDDDVDLRVAKTSNVAAGGLGAAAVFTLTYSNVTPSVLTLAPLTAHDVSAVTVSDTPTGLTLGAWTCVAAGGATCSAASGSGALPTTAAMPVGGSLTYTINTVLASAGASCQTLSSNAATVATTATGTGADALAEGTSVAGNAGYVFQPNSATASVAVLCPVKTVSVLTDLAPTGPSTGDTLRYSLSYSLPAGATTLTNVQIADTLPAGLTFSSLSVTGATALGGYAGSGNLLAAAQSLVAGATITANIDATVNANISGNLDNQGSGTATGLGAAITTDNNGALIPGDVVNQPEDGTAIPDVTRVRITTSTDLRVTKTDSTGNVTAGGTTTYTLVVSNLGPSSANNAVLADPAVTGLSVTGVVCSGTTGGAVCPATVTVVLLQGGGLVIPTLPSGATVTFTVTANVTATGN